MGWRQDVDAVPPTGLPRNFRRHPASAGSESRRGVAIGGIGGSKLSARKLMGGIELPIITPGERKGANPPIMSPATHYSFND